MLLKDWGLIQDEPSLGWQLTKAGREFVSNNQDLYDRLSNAKLYETEEEIDARFREVKRRVKNAVS